MKRFVLPIALAVSLAANVLLAAASLRYFENSVALRLDPAGLQFHAADRAKTPPPGRPVLVFYGDSRAKMWPDPVPPTGYAVVNRGVGYQTTAQILLRFDEDVAPLHPAVVVVEAGVNDLKSIADFPKKRDEIVADCETNLRRIVERGRETGATVVLSTIFDIGDVALWRRPFWSDDVRAAVHQVNAFLAELATSAAPTAIPPGRVGVAAGASAGPVLLFDANAVLLDGHGDIQGPYQLDHLHLREAGYDALNRKLAPLLGAIANTHP